VFTDCDSAAALFKPDGQEEVWDDLRALRTKIARHSRVDSALQEWSQGIVGGKTFQQLTEEFAAVVIPKVWEREGRKVARVAARLSVSPKKVRRVLQAAGLLSRSQPD
jgi:DNA-binding NtrC family response regulator